MISTISDIRSQFPALGRRQGSTAVAYFDGPGGTQVPRVVVDAMADYLLHHNANTHWRYPTSAETDDAIAGAGSALADFLGGAPEVVGFGRDTRTLTLPRPPFRGRPWGPGGGGVEFATRHR